MSDQHTQSSLWATGSGFLDAHQHDEDAQAWLLGVNSLDPAISSFSDLAHLVITAPNKVGCSYIFAIVSCRVWLTVLADCDSRVRSSWTGCETDFRAQVEANMNFLREEDSSVMFALDLVGNPFLDTRQNLQQLFQGTASEAVKGYLAGLIYFRTMCSAISGQEFI